MKNHDHLPNEDMPLIEKELIVLPPVGGRMIYLVQNLHKTPHSGELVSNLSNITTKLEQNGIKHTTIDSTAYSDTGVVDLRTEWGYVGLSNNNSTLQNIKNLSTMECRLVKFLVEDAGLKDDKAQGKRKLKESVKSRLRWGFVRVQPRSNKSSCELYGNLIPSTSVREFEDIPSPCKDFLTMIAENSCEAVNNYFGRDALSNPTRKYFSKALHDKMGYPDNSASFEYYDIVITSSRDHLQRHMDYLNDDRDNYNISCIYSFFNILDGKEYKVSFIMTTRRCIGAALESICKKKIPPLIRMFGSIDTSGLLELWQG